MKRRKFGKTRKDTRWKRGESVVVEVMRKQGESEGGGVRGMRERDLRLLRLENTPEGRVVSSLSSRNEEQITIKKEGEKDDGMERKWSQVTEERPVKKDGEREKRRLE